MTTARHASANPLSKTLTSESTPAVPRRIAKFASVARALRCPVCGGGMQLAGTSLRCGNRHSFDIASKGYVNLLTRQSAAHGYDAGFFEARKRVFSAGLYGHVLQAVLDALEREASLADEAVSPVRTAPIVDAGCGEGYYAKAILDAMRRMGANAPVIGLDTSRDAIQQAARGGGGVCWLVADVAKLPIADASAGAILNIFTPANYTEFLRALEPGGMLIKVVPGKNHLIELRELAGGLLRHEHHSNKRVIEHWKRYLPLEERIRAARTFPVVPELASAIFRMTPLLFNVDAAKLDPTALTSITIDAELLIGHRRD